MSALPGQDAALSSLPPQQPYLPGQQPLYQQVSAKGQGARGGGGARGRPDGAASSPQVPPAGAAPQQQPQPAAAPGQQQPPGSGEAQLISFD